VSGKARMCLIIFLWPFISRMGFQTLNIWSLRIITTNWRERSRRIQAKKGLKSRFEITGLSNQERIQTEDQESNFARTLTKSKKLCQKRNVWLTVKSDPTLFKNTSTILFYTKSGSLTFDVTSSSQWFTVTSKPTGSETAICVHPLKNSLSKIAPEWFILPTTLFKSTRKNMGNLSLETSSPTLIFKGT